MNQQEPENQFVELEPEAADPTPATTASSQTGAVAQRNVGDRQSDVQILQDLMPDLRLNTLTNRMEYGPRTNPTVLEGHDLELSSTKLAVEHSVYIPENRIKQVIRYVAEANSYCPIKRFLMEVNFSESEFPQWDELGKYMLGTDLPLATKALQRFFIGAVARAYNPGCNNSWIPIFIGKQGCGKSQLIRECVPKDLFAEMTVGLDVLQKEMYRMHVGWIIELPEIDNFFQNRHIETFKNLITTRTDEVRFPYAALPQKLERRFVMAGTSNRNEFLLDPSGNRRFIPLEVAEGFETPWRELPQVRGQIWKSALKAYEAGETWEITTGELAQIHNYIQQFACVDPWESLVVNYLDTVQETTTTQVLINGLSFQPQACSRRESNRVAAIMTSLGWRRIVTSRGGKSVRLWKRPKNQPVKETNLGDF